MNCPSTHSGEEMKLAFDSATPEPVLSALYQDTSKFGQMVKSLMVTNT